ncbi:MAG: diguanylate cyclase [Gemmatimonadetes bacterium]|uniref:diguanylate cyclase n=1 Tax=Candidatus Kutchimonas denitrificans TaxID=3056748 RepID=A0AAE4Z6M0_9BACT|nr:diguanylate cyclase [Gemmatimonadota bacterium]NIR74314.1 diguanylate cyclase [Candidatus Kutchimonas denitrificans]NIS01370.1 diguanylate cyclase [Gemmatimonadota bacterium]NIT67110.1 diguanylate cyclase [Gemmatimonadota bacterium]NIU52766.1 diguanylate cyclase [Gemmatimonadota bacterium]
MSLTFRIDPQLCVDCMACVRVCPVEAVQTLEGSLRIIEDSCIECGLCVPACGHDAISAAGDLAAMRGMLAGGAAVLILGTESTVHFYPAALDQVIGACYAAGFRAVYPSVLGDELVAHEYLRLWRDRPDRTTIRSTSPIVVEYVKRKYPELLPYLVPVATPAVAQARYLQKLHGDGAKIVYCGIGNLGAPEADEEPIDASITFDELEQLLEECGAVPLTQPKRSGREIVGRRRHLSTAGGMPLPVLEEERAISRRFRKVRGLAEVPAIAEAIGRSSGEPRLGFIDLLPYERDLDHPVMGPKAQLYLRREIAAGSEPARSSVPVIDMKLPIDLSVDWRPAGNGGGVTAEDVEKLIDERIGRAADGRTWDCGACGFEGCEAFAAAVLRARARLEICPFYQAKRYEQAVEDAAYDALTRLYSYRVLRSRIIEECARVRRTGGKFVVIFLDLDRFKPVNDRLGHAAGNQVLRDVAQIIRESIRANDFAARFGGDEFVIILPDGDKNGALRVASDIRTRVGEVRARADGTEMSVSVSVGIAEVGPGDSLTAGYDEMLAAADAALLEAKRAGGDIIKIHD